MDHRRLGPDRACRHLLPNDLRICDASWRSGGGFRADRLEAISLTFRAVDSSSAALCTYASCGISALKCPLWVHGQTPLRAGAALAGLLAWLAKLNQLR